MLFLVIGGFEKLRCIDIYCKHRGLLSVNSGEQVDCASTTVVRGMNEYLCNGLYLSNLQN